MPVQKQLPHQQRVQDMRTVNGDVKLEAEDAPAVGELGDGGDLLVREQLPHQQRVLRDLAQVRKHVGRARLAQLAHDLGGRGRRVRPALRRRACSTCAS